MHKDDLIARTLADKAGEAQFSNELSKRIKATLRTPWYLRWVTVGQRRGAVAAVFVATLVLVAGISGAYSGLLDELLKNPHHTSNIPIPPQGQQRVVEMVGTEFQPLEAAKVVGFELRLPEKLPAGVNPEDVTVMVGRIVASGTPIVTISYWSLENNGAGLQQTTRLILRQKPHTGAPWFGTEEHLVQGTQGATCEFEGVPLKPGVLARFATCSSGDFLTWEYAGVEHLISMHPSISLDEAIQIARSIN